MVTRVVVALVGFVSVLTSGCGVRSVASNVTATSVGQPAVVVQSVAPTAPVTTPPVVSGRTVGLVSAESSGFAPLSRYLDIAGCPSTAVLEQVGGVLGGCVVYANWSDLEPARGSFVFDPIDVQLDRVRAWNTSHPADPIGLRLRLLTGARSPGWSLELGGPHVSLSLCGPNAVLPSCADHQNEAVPRFWNDPYGVAFDELVHALATKYSSNHDVRDVAINRCTTVFDEPMMRTFGQAANAKALLDAGYTEALDLACQHAVTDLLAATFSSTFVSQSFSTYEIPTVSNGVYRTAGSDQRAIELMAYMRSKLGGRAVLGNNELGRGPVHVRYNPNHHRPRRHGHHMKS